MNWRLQVVLLLGVLLFCSKMAYTASPSFAEFCSSEFEKNGICPTVLCESLCVDGSNTQKQNVNCPLVCAPRKCESFSVQSCPEKFCWIVEDCAKEKSCQPKLPSNVIPDCGNLGYSGFDVQCCEGFVKRCGFDFLDGSCNMEGRQTAYQFPICIPCGDGVCTNFENHCNCPEDCHKDIIPLTRSFHPEFCNS